VSRLLEVKITKGVLFLEETELLHALGPDLLAAALERGKHLLRSRRRRERQPRVTAHER